MPPETHPVELQLCTIVSIDPPEADRKEAAKAKFPSDKSESGIEYAFAAICKICAGSPYEFASIF